MPLKFFIGAMHSVVILLILGCSPSGVTITEDNKDVEIAPKDLRVFLFPPTIHLTVDVSEDLGRGVAQDVYCKYFAEEFPGAFRRAARVDRVEMDSSMARYSFVDKEFILDSSDTIKVRVPADGLVVRSDSLVPDFLLILTKMEIGREANDPNFPFPAMQSPTIPAGPTGKLVHTLQFTVWDNVKRRPVSYGRLKIESPIMGTMSKWNWDECLRGIAAAIAKRGPFKPSPDLEKTFTR